MGGGERPKNASIAIPNFPGVEFTTVIQRRPDNQTNTGNYAIVRGLNGLSVMFEEAHLRCMLQHMNRLTAAGRPAPIAAPKAEPDEVDLLKMIVAVDDQIDEGIRDGFKEADLLVLRTKRDGLVEQFKAVDGPVEMLPELIKLERFMQKRVRDEAAA